MSNYKTRHGKLIEDPMKIMEFITGGNSVFTIKNTKSGNRATYKAIKPDLSGNLFEVWVLTGGNNQRKTDYTMIGVVTADGEFKPWTVKDACAALIEKIKDPKGHWIDDKAPMLQAVVSGERTVTANMHFRISGACSKYNVPKPDEVKDPVRLQAFPWTWNKIRFGEDVPKIVEVWHEGGCCRCAHKLTVPASIEMGMGPDCAEHTGRYEDWVNLNKLLGEDLEAYAAGMKNRAA